MANRFLNNIRINDEYTLPSQDGTADQIIATDGAGNLSFVDAAVTSADSNLVYYDVKNSSGATINKGKAVRAVGTDGNSGHILIDEMVADGSIESKYFIGVLETTLDNGDIGRVFHFGELDQFNTLGQNGETWNNGDILWLDPSNNGDYTITEPNGPNLKVAAAIIKNVATNGKIHVRVQANEGVHDLHDVTLGALGEGDLLTYDSSLQVWKDSGQSTTAAQMPSGTTAERPTGVNGMLRYNTDDNQFEGYANSTWGAIAGSGGGSGGGELLIERDVFTATALQTAFTISSAITASSNTQVYIDGVYQAKSNYTTSGSTITFSTGVPAGAEVEVVHFISVLSKVYTDTFTGDASTVNFTASKDVTDENVTQVYIDGVYQSKDNYTTSGTTITFSTAPPSDSAIEVVHFTPAVYSTMNSNQFTGTGSQTDFTLTQGVTIDNSFVFIQGVYQEKDTYSISGTTLTFTAAPLSGYSIEVITVGSVSIFNDTLYVDNFNGTGSQVDYILSTSPASENAIDVYINGLYQQKDTFSLSGSTLTFSAAPPNGSTIEVKSTGGLNNVVSSSGGGIDWQTTPKTANFPATAGEGYFVNTTSAAITVTLPSSPTAGDEVSIVDYAGTANTNNITITSSDNINGASDDVKIDYKRGGVSMVYVDATQGWIAYNAVNETAEALEPDILELDYLVVAGGGSGGTSGGRGGGGGAGGYRTSYNDGTVPAFIFETSIDYIVTVGAGGAAVSTNETDGNNGQNSTFATITATGGGGGGGYSRAGKSGGSGGGGSWSINAAGGSGNAGSYTPVEGYDGGTGGDGNYGAGGGGGASEIGADGSSTDGGNGGDGLSNTILNSTNAATASVGEVSGSDIYYAGGGGGGATGTGGTGGLGGSSDGTSGAASANATANTGGGSGGAGASGTGSGGSGVVILRYPSSYSISETTSGGNVLTFNTYTEGSDNVTVFTSGTNGTIQFS